MMIIMKATIETSNVTRSTAMISALYWGTLFIEGRAELYLWQGFKTNFFVSCFVQIASWLLVIANIVGMIYHNTSWRHGLILWIWERLGSNLYFLFQHFNKTWQRGLRVSRRELGREFFDQFLVVSSSSDPSSDPLIRFEKKVLLLCLSKVWPSAYGKHQIYHYILYHISYILPACGTTRRGCPCWPSGYGLDIYSDGC